MIILKTESDMYKLFAELKTRGVMARPRGVQTLELESLSYTTAPRIRFNPYSTRNLSMNYIKREIAWYIKGDPMDVSIVAHAKIWGPLIVRGRLNSCYGEYWFKKDTGVRHVIALLKADPESRRAVIPMYGTEPEHFAEDARDVPCTTSVEFRIRAGTLRARFIMRSQDAILGMGNDLPAFSFLQEVVAVALGLPMGELTVSVGSFHVYERHFGMLEQLLHEGLHADMRLMLSRKMPPLESADIADILQCKVPTETAFGQWLRTTDEA